MSEKPPPRVLFLARKQLLQNTRIFKQVAGLLAAGYEVDLIGLETPETRAKSGEASDLHPRCRVLRLPFNPPHARVYRQLRRIFRRQPAVVADGAPTPVNPHPALERLIGPLLWPLRSLDWYLRVYRLATRSLPPPDIVHCNDLDTLLVGLALARRRKAPLVYDAQELYTEQHTLPGWYARLLSVQERLLLGLVDRVIAVNDAIAAAMERRYGRRVDAVVQNAAPATSSVPQTVREAGDIPAEVPVLVYSGGLLPHRGLENTVLALRRLPGWTLAIVGEGPSRDDLVQLAAEAGVSDRIRFLDYVPHESVPAFLRSADVGVIPYPKLGLNRELASPSKLFHYIAAGLPIASSDLPFLRTVIETHGIGALFDPERPESIADAVERLGPHTRPPDMEERLAQASRLYRWEDEERRFLEIYESLVPSS